MEKAATLKAPYLCKNLGLGGVTNKTLTHDDHLVALHAIATVRHNKKTSKQLWTEKQPLILEESNDDEVDPFEGVPHTTTAKNPREAARLYYQTFTNKKKGSKADKREAARAQNETARERVQFGFMDEC